MCGIVGIWQRRQQDLVEPSLVSTMLDAIRHRGPDDAGVWTGRNLALGHRRLSIIDPGASGHQPMLAPEGRGALSYNGEIYNYLALRRLLENEGVQFVGNSDSEVLLHALDRWGPERTIPLLNGMFAFLYYDARSEALWLTRDRLGIKTLFFADTGDALLFASEVKALLAHPSIRGEIDDARLLKSLVAPRRSHETMYRDILGIPPGTWWRVSAEGVRTHTWYDVEDALDVDRLVHAHRSGGDLSAMTSSLRQKLKDSVRMHLASDAPVAAMCSGGVDSSLIAAYASDDRPSLVGYVADAPVGSGEAAQAAKVARHIGIELRTVPISRELFLRLWPVTAQQLGSPPVHASNTALFEVARVCRADGVKVLLTGEGADELFGGYPYYAAPWRLWRRRQLALTLAPFLISKRRRERWAAFPLRSAGSAAGFESAAMLSVIAEAEEDGLAARLFERLSPLPAADRAFLTIGFVELTTHLSWLLHRHDHVGMAASIEMRVPFIENALIDFAMHLPMRARRDHGQGKWIEKSVALERLPRDVVFAKKKGFPMPPANTAGSEGLLADGALAERFKWSSGTVAQLRNVARLNARMRFSLVSAELWLRIATGCDTPEALGEMLVSMAPRRAA